MKKRMFNFIVLNILLMYSFSYSYQLRVIEQETMEAVGSINIGTNDSIKLCLQALDNAGSQEKWENISGNWLLPASLTSPIIDPDHEYCRLIYSDTPVEDSIIIKVGNDSLVIPVFITNDIVTKINIMLLNDPLEIKYGDTVNVVVKISNKTGLFSGEKCIDSITYIQNAVNASDSLTVLIINDINCKFNVKTKQCFFDGKDTIKIVVKDSSRISQKYFIVKYKNLIDSTVSFSLPTIFTRENRYESLGKDLVFLHKNGILQFKVNLLSPATIMVSKINGEVIHLGKYIPTKLQQYKIPAVLTNGYYLLEISSKNYESCYPFLLIR